MKKILTVTALAVAASLALTGSALPSDAPGVATDSDVLPMGVAGFDAAVAEAHGYKIVADENGNLSSVPVTPEAFAEEARAAEARAAANPHARGESNLDTCGKVWVDASKGTNDMLTGKIGWQTYNNVAKYNWTLVAVAVIQGWAVTWNGGGNGANVGTSWSAESKDRAIGPGFVTTRNSQVDGYVVLTNGTKCQVGFLSEPKATFP